MSTTTRYVTRRRLLQGTAAAGAISLVLPGKAPLAGGAKPYAGTTINVSTFAGPYPKIIGELIPEFEELTGIRVVYDTPAFPVYNQRADLELSTGGSAYDVLNITFIYSSRWIGAGWFTPLEDFIEDANKTPADWDIDDFLPGVLAPERDLQGRLYGIPWTVDTYLAGAARFDLIDKAGLKFPDTTEELVAVLEEVHGQERAAGYVTDNHYGWTFPPFLQGYGGSIFVDPPHDLTPTLDTPEAIAAAEYFASLLSRFGPDGVLSYTPDQVVQSLKSGRANVSTIGQTYLVQAADETSRTKDTIAYGLTPAGPAGRYPGVAVHGFGIPAGSRNKDAAWEFIRWALDKQTTRRALTELGYSSPTRRSDIESPYFKERLTLNGYEVAQLVLDSIDLAAQSGHVRYRTIHVYPQVDKQLDRAIALIASGQATPEAAMKEAQAGSIADLRRAGVEI